MANKTVTFTKSPAGGATDNYTIRANGISGPILASGVTRAQLEAGYSITNIDPTYQTFFIISTGACTNSVQVNVTNTDTTAPTTPVLNKVFAGNGTCTLDWNTSTDNQSGIKHYAIYRKIGTGSYSFLTTTTNNSYIDSSLTNGSIYTYYIVAVDFKDNASANSNAIAATPVGTSGEAFILTLSGGSLNEVCGFSNFTTMYHNDNGNQYPRVGYYVYTNSGLTTPLNGGNLYYHADNGNVYRISNNGYINSVITGHCQMS